MLTVAILLLGGPLLLSALLTAAMVRVGPRIGLVDRPGAAGHKQHARVVPLGGGVAIFLTIAVTFGLGAAAILILQGWQPPWLPGIITANLPGLGKKLVAGLLLLPGAAALFAIGLYDDYRPLGAWPKLIGEIVVAGFTVWALDIRAAEFLPDAVSMAMTTLWIVTVINAINFIDNMDGLAGGVVALCGVIFTATAVVNGQLFVPAMLLVIVGAALGFLLFNFPPARIFMGDSGAYVLGYFLGVLTVLTTYTTRLEAQPAALAVPLIILAVPLYDLLSVLTVRVAGRRNPMVGDRSHFSHRLLGRGMSTRVAVLTIYLAVCATGLAAIFLLQLPAVLAGVVIIQTLCIVGIIAMLEFRWSGGSTKDSPQDGSTKDSPQDGKNGK